MKLVLTKELTQDVLIRAIDLVAKVADKNHRFVVLGNIKFDLSPDELILTSSDLSVELSAEIRLPEGACEVAGSLTLPAGEFNEICKSLPKGTNMVIESFDDGRCQIKAGKSKFTLATLPASDYPSIGTAKNKHSLVIQRQSLQDMIAHTRFCMATQDVRHYLTGMLFHVVEQTLTLVATEGHRLALARYALPDHYEPLQAIVPGRAVIELERLLNELNKQFKQDALIELGLDDEFLQLRLNFGTNNAQPSDSLVMHLTARLIDGKFPDYTRVIPSEHMRTAYVDKEIFTDALRRVSILAGMRGVIVQFSPDGGMLSNVNTSGGEARENFPLRLEGEALELAFSEAYLKSVFAVLDGEIQWQLSNENAAALISQVGDDRYQYVVMPMRI